MADTDTSKSQKLAAARKKFKELKKKKDAAHKGSEEIGTFSQKSETPIESLTSSTHSSINDFINNDATICERDQQYDKACEDNDSTNLPDYFGPNASQTQTSKFFDNITVSINPENDNFKREKNQSDTGMFNNPVDVENYEYINLFNNYSFQYDTPLNLGGHPLSVKNEKDPVGCANTFFSSVEDSLIKTDCSGSNIVLDTQAVDECKKQPEQQQVSKVEVLESKLNDPNIAIDIAENAVQSQVIEETIQSFENRKNESVPQISNVESLLQLSNQMAQLIEPGGECKNEASDLEKRNIELAANLEAVNLKCNQFAALNTEYQNRIKELELQLKNALMEKDLSELTEISHLKDELQTHIQTIGVLVGEKTELSAALSQLQVISKQRACEMEELQNRLKASRTRVVELEKEVLYLKENVKKHEDFDNNLNKSYNQLQSEFQNVKDENEEIKQDLLETKEKLKNYAENNTKLQSRLNEVENHLSLANIKIQQLTHGANQQIDGQVETLMMEKLNLEKKVSNLSSMLKTMTKEKDDSNLQYQQYAQQLNAQLTTLAKKLEQLQNENESLVIQEQNRIKHISELERQLQNLQNDHINYSTTKFTGENKNEMLLLNEKLKNLESSFNTLQDSYMKLCNEKDMLLKELETKKITITQLEDTVERLKENRPNNTQLMADIESDKVAAARAMSQNIELKNQLEGMHEVFIKLNNDKVELTEKLTKEIQSNKNLLDKLQKTETHLSTLADAIEIKDKELINLRENFNELNKSILQQNQLNDRLRHYEAQNGSVEALKHELQEAQVTIDHLNHQLQFLKLENNVTDEDKSGNISDKLAPASVHAVSQQEKPDETVDNLKQELISLEEKNKNLELELEHYKDHRKNSQAAKNSFQYSMDDLKVLDKETAMKRLEHKFLHTMEEIARLTEEKQYLEHLVLQLQGETETIGEYVALYQYQRSILNQRALEKDQQLKQLASDREKIKSKLEQLDYLITKLVNEKGVVNKDLLLQGNKLLKESEENNLEVNAPVSGVSHDVPIQTNILQHSSTDTETKEQIIALLSEIKSSNLIQPVENYNHCPWCSGQLITV